MKRRLSAMNDNNELPRDDSTEYIYDDIFSGDPVFDPSSPQDLIDGINKALELDSAPIFADGLAKRLTELNIVCTKDDTDIVIAEVKRRFKRFWARTVRKR